MDWIRRHIGMRTIKTAIGAALAVFIAQSLNVSYAANAGIIVILSVQATKRKSLDLAVMRIGSTILALAVGTLVFSTVGFTAIAFGLYLLIFIPIAVKLKFHDGIVPCSVLVSHLLAVQSVAIEWLGNEMLQMLIGAGIGFILNLYMPSLEKQIEDDRATIDDLIRNILDHMAYCLRRQQPELEDERYGQLADRIKQGFQRALRDAENRMSRERTEHLRFMELRNSQYDLLVHMKRYFKRLYVSYEQTHMVADLTDQVAAHFTEREQSDQVFGKINDYRNTFKKMNLPATREEFENRATLYEYINDLEHFLNLKNTIC